MSDPITTDDLYGPSKSESGPLSPDKPELTYEETPEIAPQETSQPQLTPPHELPPVGYIPKKKSGSCLGTIGTIILFIALFAVGIWLSSFVRQFIPGQSDDVSNDQRDITATPTGVASEVPLGASPSAAATWKTYQVINGVTKEPVVGVSIQLPADVLAPICDSTSCASQGTFLPGGTRLTIAPRGTGQVLPDFRGSVVSDVNGVAFTTKPIIVQGVSATEFSGVFTGRTISGYAFSAMRGVMIPLTATQSLEINHFTPSGIVADFERDDKVFNTILGRLTLPKPVAASPTRAATSSGTTN